MVITPHDRNWRAVRLKDDTSADYLNTLLQEGWYVMDVGVPGLPALAFVVPLEPPTDTTFRWQKRGQPREDQIVMLVLHKGTAPGRQKGIVTRRDAAGYLDMRLLQAEPGWKQLIVLEMESGAAISIMEQHQKKR